MNLNKDPSSWARVSPDAVMSGSDAQVRNVLTMALQDIARLAAENGRLRADAEQRRNANGYRRVLGALRSQDKNGLGT